MFVIAKKVQQLQRGKMRPAKFVLFLFSAASALAQTQLCNPKVITETVVATAQQRYQAGQIAEPPLTDTIDGFAWPDTPLGVIKNDNAAILSLPAMAAAIPASSGTDTGMATTNTGR